jgi:hypothetical protein
VDVVVKGDLCQVVTMQSSTGTEAPLTVATTAVALRCAATAVASEYLIPVKSLGERDPRGRQCGRHVNQDQQDSIEESNLHVPTNLSLGK